MVKNETRKIFKGLRSYNGGEYHVKEFYIYFSYHGVPRENIVSRIPQEMVCQKG